MNRTTQVAIIIAVIAITLLAIVTYLWVKDEARLHSGVGNISATKDQIRQDCAGTDAQSRAACAQDLQDLSDMLASLKAASSTGSGAPVTGPSTGSTQAAGTIQFAPTGVNVQTTPVAK